VAILGYILYRITLLARTLLLVELTVEASCEDETKKPPRLKAGLRQHACNGDVCLVHICGVKWDEAWILDEMPSLKLRSQARGVSVAI
jgi:hypothetical protein